MSITKIFIVAAVSRILLIIYGHWHDSNFDVKYTDVDYQVFTDAAAHVQNGSSPYKRQTYRYTPLLAYLLLPNCWIHRSFGKLFFSLCDILVAMIMIEIYRIECKRSHVKTRITQLFGTYANETVLVFSWLFNPLTLAISTRGNAESFQALLVLISLLCILCKWNCLGGIFYGLAIHFKIYPIIYCLPILLFQWQNHNKGLRSGMKTSNANVLINLVHSVIVFAVSAGILLIFITLLMNKWYGMEFIENTYLYHISRKDIKHNFSPYFYVLYLTKNSSMSKLIGLMAFLPQAITIIIIGLQFYQTLSVAWFLQTFAFVTFNKVCTSQYFVWYLSLLPLAMPHFSVAKSSVIWMLFLWVSSQAIWLLFAYLLEFQGVNTFLFVWLASLIFFVVNIYILFKLVSNVRLKNQNIESVVIEKDE